VPEPASFHVTVGQLIAAVCRPEPDQAAWGDLEMLAQETLGAQAPVFLVGELVGGLQSVDELAQASVLTKLVQMVSASAIAPALLIELAKLDDPLARQLALMVVARIGQPLNPACRAAILPLLARRRTPLRLQLAAAVALLQTTDPDAPEAQAIVNAFTARGSKVRAVERLRQLEKRVGSLAAVRDRLQQLENRIRMRCPRCHVQMRRPDMVKHLWTDHGLLLDGRRVRTPWRQIESWVREFRRNRQAELLDRCRDLARKADPVDGMPRLQRLFLKRGIDDPEARKTVLHQAALLQATLCPRCYGLVPTMAHVEPRILNESRGRLSLSGYCVELLELGLVPRLLVEIPGAVLYRGREPGRWLTRRGVTLLLATPLVLAALVVALLMPTPDDFSRPVTALLASALVVYLALMVREKLRPSLLNRAVDHAWMLMVPYLNRPKFVLDDSSFLAGLALSSMRRGNPDKRSAVLALAVDHVEDAVAHRLVPGSHLAAIKRLQIADMAVLGRDPAAELARGVARCFDGSMPLGFADMLLDCLDNPWWNPVNRARLRILLCDLAFEAAMEVSDLVETGHTVPALGACLQIEEPEGLAHLRLLWSMRARCPWLGWSEPVSAFELATRPEHEASLLGKCPDLLLFDSQDPQVKLVGRGILLGETLFTSMPHIAELLPARDVTEPVATVAIDDLRLDIEGNAREAVRRLRSWFHFAFQDFFPQAKSTFAWQAPNGPRGLHYEQAVLCQSCRCLLLPRPGEVGIRVSR
jgi:hypothetical protein